MTRSPPVSVEEIRGRSRDRSTVAVAVLEARGIIASGKSPLGMENIRWGSQDREFMDPINIATRGGWLSGGRTAARSSYRLRRRQQRALTRRSCSRKSLGER